MAEAHGTGTRRIYNFQDVVALRVANELRRAGVPLQSLRRVVEVLRDKLCLDHPMAEGLLVTDGVEVYLKNEDATIALLREPGQRLLFQVVDLDRAVGELRSAVNRLQEAEDTQLKRSSQEAG